MIPEEKFYSQSFEVDFYRVQKNVRSQKKKSFKICLEIRNVF